MSTSIADARAHVLTKAEAHQLLDEARAGVPHPKRDIARALAATGDLRGWMVRLMDADEVPA